MGRPRKPAQVHEISGAYNKNPQRRRVRASEPVITAALGDPPREWTEKAAHSDRSKFLVETWNRLIAQDVLKVLNASHRMLVEITCYLMYKIDRASKGLGKASSGDFAQVKANLGLMGQTPFDSARVSEAVKVKDRGGPSSERQGAGGWGELAG